MKLLLSALTLLLASVVRAQPIVDGFEDSGVSWTQVGSTFDGGSLEVSSLAAHRGALGLRLVEVPRVGPDGGPFNADGGVWFAAGAYRVRTVQLTAPSLFARFWFRGQTTGTGRSVLAGSNFQLDGGGTSTAFSWNGSQSQPFGMSTVLLDGGSSSLLFFTVDGGFANGWHLHEVTQSGLGTSGRFLAAIDGRVVAELPTLSVGAIQYRDVQLGTTFISGVAASIFDYDDLMVGSVPLASRLRASVDAGGASSGCVEVTAWLENTFVPDASVPAPYGIDLEVPGVPTFNDPDCAQPKPWLFSEREVTTRAFVRLDAGLQTVMVRQVQPEDVLPANVVTTVTVSAAGGGGTGSSGGQAGGASSGGSAGGSAGGSDTETDGGVVTRDDRGPYYQCSVSPWLSLVTLVALLLRGRSR